MSSEIKVEPLSVRVRGVTLDRLLSKEFVGMLKSLMPSVVAGHLMIGFTDSDQIIAITHERKDKKVLLDHLDVEGDDHELILKVVKAIEEAVK